MNIYKALILLADNTTKIVQVEVPERVDYKSVWSYCINQIKKTTGNFEMIGLGSCPW